MKVNNCVVINREHLGGFTVMADDYARNPGVKAYKAAVTTLEEALEVASKFMEEEK